MLVTDIFNNDAFSAIPLTEGVNNIPHVPKIIERMGVFQGDTTGDPSNNGAGSGVASSQVAITEKDGEIQLIPTAALGSMENYSQSERQRVRYFDIPHLQYNDTILAAELNGRRTFGQQSETLTVDQQVEMFQQVFLQKQARLKRSHVLTWEWHRIGAIKGKVLNANGTDTVYDWFSEFGITKKTFTWTKATAGDITRVCDGIVKHITKVLAMDVVDNIHCFVGDDFMTALSKDATVLAAFDRWNNGQMKRDSQVYGKLNYKGITFENYRGSLGSTDFVASAKGHAFPVGSSIMQRKNGNGSLIEAVGTDGLPMYSNQEVKKHNTGWDLHTQSNPIFYCTRPAALVEITAA